MNLDQFLSTLWDSYTQYTPSAQKIRSLLESRGEMWVNDHIAFRTFDLSPINLAALEPHLLALGYQRYEPYVFEEKKLRAYGYLHPEAQRPRIFLSELETHKLSARAQELVASLVAQVDAGRLQSPDCLHAGLLWKHPTEKVYRELLQESEYAGWMAVNGLCPNHFTVSVNGLTQFADLDALMSYLEEHGFVMNLAGGRIKGTPEVKLVQGSTVADRGSLDGYEITTCYVEFAQRYDGFNGFVPQSANKIFESTNVNRN